MSAPARSERYHHMDSEDEEEVSEDGCLEIDLVVMSLL